MRSAAAIFCRLLILSSLLAGAACVSHAALDEGEAVPIHQLELTPAEFDGRRILVVGFFTLKKSAITIPERYWAMHDASPVRLKSGATALYCNTPEDPNFLVSGIRVTRSNGPALDGKKVLVSGVFHNEPKSVPHGIEYQYRATIEDARVVKIFDERCGLYPDSSPVDPSAGQ